MVHLAATLLSRPSKSCSCYSVSSSCDCCATQGKSSMMVKWEQCWSGWFTVNLPSTCTLGGGQQLAILNSARSAHAAPFSSECSVHCLSSCKTSYQRKLLGQRSVQCAMTDCWISTACLSLCQVVIIVAQPITNKFWSEVPHFITKRLGKFSRTALILVPQSHGMHFWLYSAGKRKCQSELLTWMYLSLIEGFIVLNWEYLVEVGKWRTANDRAKWKFVSVGFSWWKHSEPINTFKTR